MTTTQQLEERIDAVLDAVLDLPANTRMEAARKRCGDDPALWAAVHRVLDVDLNASDFLEPEKDTPPDCAASDMPFTERGTRIGAWEVVGILGRGGMGEVLQVRRADGQYEMRAALKRLHEQGLEHADRLARERQILAALKHPHIAQLIDGGVDTHGHPWMVMEYVEGEPLSTWAATATLEQKLDVFAQIVSAVSHAHGQLVIHRDIKPSNILVDAQGHARLLDFGIAKLLNALHTGDRTQALATPNFAAPEQLLGESVAVHADIYGLGATLYALLCNRPPLQLEGESLPVVIDRVRHSIPPPPSSVVRSIPADLDAVCLKCLNKQPDDRYRSADELAQELVRFREGFPVLARRPGNIEHLTHFLRRQRALVTAIATVLAVLVGGLVLTARQADIARQERDAARQEAMRLNGLRNAVSALFRKTIEADTSLTARELFARAGTSADESIHSDPATASALLQMLGHLQLQAEDYPASRALLQRVLDLPRQKVAPSVLADTHLDMAHLAFRERDFGAVRDHLNSAQKLWLSSDLDSRSESLQVATLKAQLARAEGRPADAIRALKEATALARDYWGEQHPETAAMLVNLGATQYYGGDIPGAIESSQTAYDIYQKIGEDQSPDALNLLANWGVYALRAGRPVEAETRLTQALQLRTRLYGASTAQAILMKNLGLAHLVNGRHEDGMDLLEQSQWMAERYAGPAANMHVSTACTLARVLLDDGRSAEAAQTLDALPEEVFSRDTHWAEFCSGLRKLAQHGSRADLTPELQSLHKRGDRHLIYHAELLATYGHVLSHDSDWESAATVLQAAADGKAAVRGKDHYETLTLQLEAANARHQSGHSSEARTQHRQALQALAQSLGPAHPLVERYSDASPGF